MLSPRYYRFSLLAMVALLVLLAACGPGAYTPTVVVTPTGTTAPATATVAAPASTATAAPTNATEATAAPTYTVAVAEPTATAATEPPTATVPEPTATAPAQAGSERILYLDGDGQTIRAIDPAGGEPQVVFTATLGADETISDLSANTTGDYLLYGVSASPGFFPTKYTLVHDGAATLLDVQFTGPRWSPDGTRFIAQALDPSGSLGPIYLYDVTRGNGGVLAVNGVPDWYPDGQRIVYASGANIYTYDFGTGLPGKLTDLPDDDTNRWVTQSAHVLPDSNRVVFYGGQQTKDGVGQLGPHGEGEQWWILPAEGGEPAPWAASSGNSAFAFSANRVSGWATFVQSAWAGALCSAEQKVAAVEFTDPALPVIFSPSTGLNAEGTQTTMIRGLSWSPAGNALTFAAEPANCTPDGPQAAGATMIYVWTIESTTAGDAQARQLVAGSYPQWVAASR